MSLSIAIVVLDGLVLVALAGTIYYAASLSRALSVLRGGRAEFSNRLSELTDAISKANSTVCDLKAAGNTVNVQLKSKVDEANAINAELGEVCGAAQALAGRLETLSSKGRRAVAPDAASPLNASRPVEKSKPSAGINNTFKIRDPEFDGAQVHSRAERELLEALRKAKASSNKAGIEKDSRLH